MANLEDQIQERIQQFVTEISALVRQAAIESVQSALSGEPFPVTTFRARPTNGRRRAKVLQPQAQARAGKRSPFQIAATEHKVTEFLRKNPGQGVEKIAAALNTSTKELVLPIRHLLGEKKIRTQGQRRATRYFPAPKKGA